MTLALSFVNPAFLGFLALAGVPVLIYLFNRHRYKTISWAAMAFVARAMKKNRRRLRFENLLLLFLRVAIVALLVLGLARPVGKAIAGLGDLTEKRRQLAIVIDTSYSMGYRQGAQTSLDRAKKTARDLADALLKRGDRFGLLTMAGEPRALYPDPVFVDDLTKARILAEIQEIEPSAGTTDASKALAALAQYLPRFAGGAAAGAEVPKQVYIITDMQKSAFATDRGLRDPNVRRTALALEKEKAEITFVDCGADDAANLAVTRLDMADELAGVDLPARIDCTVKSFAPRPAEASLEFFVDDLLQGARPVALEPGEEKEIELYATFREKGPHKVHVVLRSDDLPIDNARYLVVDARESVDVPVVDGEKKPDLWESETDFLVAALAPGEDSRIGRENLIRPRVVADPSISEEDLSKAGAVVLANVIALSDDQVERLEQYVRRGGGLLVFLGTQVDRTIYNEKLWKHGKGLLPAPIGETVVTSEDERFFTLAADTFSHPVLRPFAAPDTRPLFGSARFTGYMRLEMPEPEHEDPAVSVLARFEPRRATAAGGEAREGEAAGRQADPALVEKHFGRGRVLVFASSADGDWNKFYAQFGYLMLWQKAVTYLADAGSARRNLLVGDVYEQLVPSSEYAPEILLTTPAQDPIEKTLEKVPDEPDRFRLTHAETLRPGFYDLKFGAPSGGAARTDSFAVNVDAEEADLVKIDAQELKTLLPELHAAIEPDRGIERLVHAPERGKSEDELWRYALLGMLGLMIAETTLACWFGRKAA
jgi:Mg-chelatase subunit ChlD